jgi:3-methylcrotonyl-CoA carboxylase alpha subunit
MTASDSSPLFDSLLVANRGEIACRVMRTARRLGLRTIAVYSDADANALHVREADVAFRIGPAAAAESYLRADAILEAAAKAGAAAIHPGYGFLSENAAFAEACEKAGIIFVGPPAPAIRAMGSKSEAKAIMEKAGVPLVPGYHGEEQDPDFLAKEAERIGFPVLIKASAGGGGKGMRAVDKAAGFAEALAGAKREAASAFGDERVLIERYLTQPRHIEIQVFADNAGEAVYLHERDCSVQRRHQKVLEEAPAPGLTPEQRREMGEAAVAAAKAIGYRGAGTVEFIAEDGAFFFMEMNTRLQVEHPVTEAITGQDLVEWQLRVAAGQALPLSQEEIPLKGHAIEARLYAEDASKDFLPATGRLKRLRFPGEGEGLRIDAGVAQGDEVTPFYDPMIAKIIAWGPDRPAALKRLALGLADLRVQGCVTNADFLVRVLRHPDFEKGGVDTGFLGRARGDLLKRKPKAGKHALAALALAELQARRREAEALAARSGDPHSPWFTGEGWRLNAETHSKLRFLLGEETHEAAIHFGRDGTSLEVGGERLPAGYEALDNGDLAISLGAERFKAGVLSDGAERLLFLDGEVLRFTLDDPQARAESAEAGGGSLSAPMPAKVTAILAAVGDSVESGQALVVLEAMKMEHTLRAPVAGTVSALHYEVGDLVGEGSELISLEEAQ